MKYLFVTVFIALSLMIFRPIPTPTEQNCVLVEGIVEEIREGEGEADIVFKLQDDSNYYYINRGLERALTIEGLKATILQKNIQLRYVKHWSLLNFNNSSKHIAKITFRNAIIYDEMT